MDKKNTIIIALIIVCAVVFYVVISFKKTTMDTSLTPNVSSENSAGTTTWENAPAEMPQGNATVAKMVVTAKHAYKKGIHTIVGEIPLPTPCHILESAIAASPDGQRISISFVSSVKTGDVCASVVTPARFKLTVKAGKDATMTASLNGQNVLLNLIEVSPDENIDDFDLYIKG